MKNQLSLSQAYLHFADGTTFCGKVNRPLGDSELEKGIWGEAAFTTGMTGYQETITDPSFLGQHIIFTSSHIGNYPENEKVSQSKTSYATCIIARNFTHSNTFLKNLKVPLFQSVDTRSLVRYLTKNTSSHKSVLTFSAEPPSRKEFEQVTLRCQNLFEVSQEGPKILKEGENPIVLVNYGVKKSILENLLKLNVPLVSLPFTATAEEIAKFHPSMIFLSNGPGDPRKYESEIQEVKKMLGLGIPIRGICLGHQLISLALGGEIIKLPFGQRGVNHPVLNHLTKEIIITSQNHGYSLSMNSLKNIQFDNIIDKEIVLTYSSLFDQSVEGLSSTDHFIKSVQFHPEGNPGPHDALEFFQEIAVYLNAKDSLAKIDSSKIGNVIDLVKDPVVEKKSIPYKKILLIGSGPIKIGQASEFDYSGTQAIKALKELGIHVVLLNSNPATIMTDSDMADKTYLEPITKEIIKKIILREKVDAVLSTMGGQTSLNLCVELEHENFLKENQVALLGANLDTITKTEDRDIFSKELDKLGYQTGKRFKANTEQEARGLSKSKVGFPLIIRRDFALGGKGSALVSNEEELEDVFKTDISFPITLEKSLLGYKEIELEVMVDNEKNGVIICSIENIDPCGIHTGDSITVAPAQTISDRCYQNLRTMALTIAKHMGVVAGGANVQFAINPFDEDDIVVIEMNPRVSRSSALASKATGYPIAKISALLSVGLTLKEILNDITKASPVAFEPTLDYVAIKLPIFPFHKFPDSSKNLGPQMRSVGEVLALGGNFNEAFLKALRALEIGLEVPSISQLKTTPFEFDSEYLERRLKSRRQLSLLTVLDALRKEIAPERIQEISQIDIWFINEVKKIADLEKIISSKKSVDQHDLLLCKQHGLSDKSLALLLDKDLASILDERMKSNILPVFKSVDTCSAEFQAETPYFYSTYTGLENEAKSLSTENRAIAILGSGPNRIGQGIEFDYSCVKSCKHLQSKNIKAIMVNSNPETVSTDYDSSDRLYLAPLFSEDLFDIFLNEKPESIITCFSGQTGINIRAYLEQPFRMKYNSLKFLGPDLKTLDLTEDRKLFASIIETLDFKQTKNQEVRGHKKLINAIVEIGLPVILRPSYVIGGESMYIINSHDDLTQLPKELKEQLSSGQITFQVENYLTDALEYDVDLVRDQFGNTVFTVCEHIEYAGVHSGDSGMITPPVALTSNLYKKMKKLSDDLAKKLNIIGPINFQFAVKDGDIYCIEANPRGSRTLPFLSKAYHLSLPALATDAILGERIQSWEREQASYFCVKQSTFPFDRFISDNIILGPKMRSTGETMGVDSDKDHAILKSYLGNYPNLATPGKILISLSDHAKDVLLPYLKSLSKSGHSFLATSGTHSFIKKQGLPCTLVAKIQDQEGIPILEALQDNELSMVFNTPLQQGSSKSDGELIRNTAISYGIPCFTRKENIRAVMEALIGSFGSPINPVNLQETKELS